MTLRLRWLGIVTPYTSHILPFGTYSAKCVEADLLSLLFYVFHKYFEVLRESRYFTNSNSYATTHGFDAHVPRPETLSISAAKALRGVSFKMSPITKWVGYMGKFFGKFGVNCLIPSRKHSSSEISCNRSHLILVMRIWYGISAGITNNLLLHPGCSFGTW